MPAAPDASPARRRSRRRRGPRSPTRSSGPTSAQATTTIRTKRARAVAERADWEALRLAGAAIKDEVLRDLPALLEQLEAAVTAAGGAVHWARDAAEANAIVARHRPRRRRRRGRQGQVDGDPGDRAQRGARARGGIAAWETDLAELIVQLGDDLPSHILVPGDPPQPARDPRHLRARDGPGRAGRRRPT